MIAVYRFIKGLIHSPAYGRSDHLLFLVQCDLGLRKIRLNPYLFDMDDLSECERKGAKHQIESQLILGEYTKFIRDVRKPRGEKILIVDIGGSYGLTGLVFFDFFKRLGFSSVHVHIFEPLKRLSFIASRFIKQNNLPSIRIHNYGISTKTDVVNLIIPHGVYGFANVFNHDEAEGFIGETKYEKINVVDISEVVKNLCQGSWRIDLMKIDAEGAEFPILQRMIETGDIEKIDRLILEVTDDRKFAGSDALL